MIIVSGQGIGREKILLTLDSGKMERDTKEERFRVFFFFWHAPFQTTNRRQDICLVVPNFLSCFHIFHKKLPAPACNRKKILKVSLKILYLLCLKFFFFKPNPFTIQTWINKVMGSTLFYTMCLSRVFIMDRAKQCTFFTNNPTSEVICQSQHSNLHDGTHTPTGENPQVPVPSINNNAPV